MIIVFCTPSFVRTVYRNVQTTIIDVFQAFAPEFYTFLINDFLYQVGLVCKGVIIVRLTGLHEAIQFSYRISRALVSQGFHLYHVSLFRTQVNIISQFPSAEHTSLNVITARTDKFHSLIFHRNRILSITDQCHTLTRCICYTCRTVAAEPLQTNISIRDTIY